MKRIGLIAGRGRFPLIFAAEAKKRGYYVVALGIRGDTLASLKRLVDKIYWLNFNELSSVNGIFSREGVGEAVMAGQVNPAHLFSRKLYEDAQLKKVIENIENKKADTIFRAIIGHIESGGIKFLDSNIFLDDHLPKQGVLTSRQPDEPQWQDLRFGYDIAKDVAGLDIGQTVCVKNKAIVAVEALEGTDNTIRRAGAIARAGFSVVKVSRPKQDMRFDIPVVGLRTISVIRKAKGACLGVEAGKTIILDKEDFIRYADRKGVAVAAL
ncbi:MAG: UDP-2,3-diacylglucosamine diphosphatase LpxI [Candidatus Omnitrophica bacterium]|nr:UDP-2,3-diacylglucosamine diphosphatase LpxI [Candidatus Omnitrophota bacterium]